jgi:hypothetical protein
VASKQPEKVAGRGALLAAQYAFPPNRLELCGPPETAAMLDYLAEQTTDRGLEEILRRFAGAFPYLHFIAASNGIADPFDRRVVEAYWIGNDLLNGVRMSDFFRHLDERFQTRSPKKLFEMLLGQVPEGARPHHNFHVFAIPLRTGHVDAGHTLETLDACRISWGAVTAVLADELLVSRRPLVLDGDLLALGAPEVRAVRWRSGGKAFSPAAPGDTVAIHWGCGCGRLSDAQRRALERETLFHLGLVNRRHRAGVLR